MTTEGVNEVLHTQLSLPYPATYGVARSKKIVVELLGLHVIA